MTSVYATSEKSLKSILKKHSGRNNTGKITVRHQGGRHKRFYRMIDFVRSKRDEEALVTTIAYDPNRTANIALVEYADGLKAYIIHCEGMKVGAHVISSETAEILPGNALPLKNIPLGTEVHNIELYPGKGGQIVKSAGSAAIVIAKEGEYVHIKLPSKEIRKILGQCYATIGRISNIEHKLKELGKAGKSRWRGIRPSVRGVAQAPNAHPHGGGEGRSGTGMHPKTKWGKPAMGKKTRKRKITNKFIISSRKQAR